MTPTLVKEIALADSSIDILEPISLRNDREIIEKLKSYDADMFIIAGYGKIIPREIIDIPKYGSVCVHPSLLPKLRGATPVQTAIIQGLEKTGVTLFLIDEEVDHGPILISQEFEIKGTDNTEALYKRIVDVSVSLIKKLFLEIKDIVPLPQNHDEATFTKKIATSDAFIEETDLKEAQDNGGEKAIMVDRKIRGFYPEPGAWTMQNNLRVKLLDSEIINGKLKLKVIQQEGKKPTIV